MRIILFLVSLFFLISCSAIRIHQDGTERFQQELLCDLIKRGLGDHLVSDSMLFIGVRPNVSPTGFLESYLNKRVDNIMAGTNYADLEFEQISLKDQSLRCGSVTFSMITWESSMPSDVLVISDLFVYNNEYFIVFLEHGSQGHEYLYKMTTNGHVEFVEESNVWID